MTRLLWERWLSWRPRRVFPRAELRARTGAPTRVGAARPEACVPWYDSGTQPAVGHSVATKNETQRLADMEAMAAWSQSWGSGTHSRVRWVAKDPN